MASKGRDRRLGQASIEIVDDDDKLVDVRGVEQLLELRPEGVDVFGEDCRYLRPP